MEVYVKERIKIYLKLFTSTLYISAFTFGGGFIMIPLMKKKFCDELQWIEEDEILDLVAIAQSSPGAIAVNTSIIIGHKVAGVLGAIVSAIATILPPLIIISVVSFSYNFFKENALISALLKGMQAGVAAVIVDVVYGMATKIVNKKEIVSILLMLFSFIGILVFNINLYILILAGVLVGVLYAFFKEKRESA